MIKKPMQQTKGNMVIERFETHTSKFSIAKIQLKGRHGRIVNKISDVTYYMLEGKAEFNINGKIENAQKGDLVLVPKKSPYDINGNAIYMVIHQPAYNPETVEKLEESKDE